MDDSLHSFKRDLTYRNEAPCARILEDLGRMAQWQREGAQRRARLTTLAWVSPLAGLFLLFAVFFVSNGLDSGAEAIAWLYYFVPLLLFVVPLVTIISREFLSTAGVDPRRQELVLQTMTLLQEDVSPEALLTLQMDLRPADHADKLAGTRTTRTGWNSKHYLDPWLSLQGRLLEGTSFQLDMTESLDQRSRSKRSRSGKTRYKTRRMEESFVRLRLRVKPERYTQLLRIGEQARGAVRLPQGARLKALRVEEDRLDLTVRMNAPWVSAQAADAISVAGTHVVAMAFLSLFHILHLSRALDKKARATR